MSATRVEFRMLGPLRIFREGNEVELTAPMQRRLLLRLLLDNGVTVSRDRLQASLWPNETEDKTRALRFHVSKLRDVVDPERERLLVTDGSGYRIETDEGSIDANVFSSAVDEAVELIDRSPETALAKLEKALSLWDGSPLLDAEFDEFARAEILRLEELRVRAEESRMQALLDLGRHEQAVLDLERLVREHPLRERLRGLQMLALYRSGRAAEALRAYRAARETLGEELGIEPSRELAELEERILFGEEDLLKAPAPAETVNTVPRPANALIGRRLELDDLRKVLDSSQVVTLTGIAGVGKTRLAQALALEPGHGYEAVWWIELAPIGSPGDVPAVVASALGVLAGSAPLDSVVDHVMHRRALLVLDNCEHVRDGAARVAGRIRETSAGVDVLATSRLPLHVEGEVIYQVPRLETEPGEDDMSEAARFMMSLATAQGRPITEPQRPAVSSIARRVDGLPLALELAVARLGTLTPAELDRRLAEDLSALGGLEGAESHRRSLSETIEWSVGLLSPEAQCLFQRLGVFAEGAMLDAIESVCSGPPLAGQSIIPALDELVQGSLVERRSEKASDRYVMIDAVSRVARKMLSISGEGDPTWDAHAVWYAEVAAGVTGGLPGVGASEAVERLGPEETNMRRALNRLMANDDGMAMKTAHGLSLLWVAQGSHSVAHETLDILVGRASQEPTPELASTLATLAFLEYLDGDLNRCLSLLERQAEVAGETGDVRALLSAPYLAARVLWAQGETLSSVEKLRSAIESIGARTDPIVIPILRMLGRHRVHVGQEDRARRVQGELRWWGDRGQGRCGEAIAEIDSLVYFGSGDMESAETEARRAIAMYRETGETENLAEALVTSAGIAVVRGNWDRVIKLALEAMELAQQTRARAIQGRSRALVGYALLESGRPDVARRHLVQSVEIGIEAPSRVDLAMALSFLSAYRMTIGDHDGAAVLHSAAKHAAATMSLSTPPGVATINGRREAALRETLGDSKYQELEVYGRFLGPTRELLDTLTD